MTLSECFLGFQRVLDAIWTSPLILTATLQGSCYDSIFQMKNLRFRESDDLPRATHPRAAGLEYSHQVGLTPEGASFPQLYFCVFQKTFPSLFRFLVDYSPSDGLSLHLSAPIPLQMFKNENI